MQQVFNQLLQFLQQGIAAIFGFIRLVWTWAENQILALTQISWATAPLWKQLVLLLIVGAVCWALYRVVTELWVAGERILAAFAALLGVLVKTLPAVAIAGAIAFSGSWIIRNMSDTPIKLSSFWSSDEPSKR